MSERERWTLAERQGDSYWFEAVIDGVEWVHHVKWKDFWVGLSR